MTGPSWPVFFCVFRKHGVSAARLSGMYELMNETEIAILYGVDVPAGWYLVFVE